jgi:hypothetical protein
VIGDIPPLAFAAAARAGVPSVALGNFTWDWIYEAYDALRGSDVLHLVGEAYSCASQVLRLPMWGGFETVTAPIQELPLVARRSRRSPNEVRERLGLPGGRLVLLSFGGYGLDRLGLSGLGDISGYHFLVPRQGGRAWPEDPPNVVPLDVDSIYASGWRYEDVVAASDVVATKPGYGIIAECAANGAAMLYTSRGNFREYGVLVDWMPRLVRSAFLNHDDFYALHWQSHLDRLLDQPRPASVPANGAEVAAEAIDGLAR